MNSAKTDMYIRVTNQSKIKTFDSEKKYREWDFGEISLLILVIFGAVTNFLTVIVMTRKRMRSSNASLYIVYIAVCDFIVLLLRFLANMIKLYRIAIYNFCILNQIVAQAASFISVWLILATSAERTAAVIFPLKVTHIFSRKRSKKIILGLVLIFVFISSTVSFCIEYSRAQPHYCQIKGSLNGTCFKYYTLIFPWFRSALGSWIPSVLGFIFSLIIIKALSNASIVRKSITNQMYSNESSRLFKLEEFKLLLMKKNHSYNSSYTADGSLASKRSSSWRTLSSLYSIQLKERQISIMLLTISISIEYYSVL
ncbi:growth hormone secretagogue receptor type 1 [Brachionus plicatilis]|uniref:Growth hormone secretagogue receptor type 1 n=1 Tax=Brachionus plicatilis TaxID=10195 RepID=A0A3M7PIN8_BRAPC|nr:growth hormone secretagogue receptor type 1 [Brachionus plicatilis]